jgi:DNA-binding NarL/FixJ family response regulator
MSNISQTDGSMGHPELRDLKILVIDDSDFIRKQLKTAYGTLLGFEVIGEATSGDEGVQMARSLRPDLIVFEPSMAGTNGVEVLRAIRQDDQRVLIVVFTAEYSAVMRDVYREAGATFFVNKARIRDLLEVSEIARKIS